MKTGSQSTGGTQFLLPTNSFLRLNQKNTIPAEEMQYLPEAQAPAYIDDTEINGGILFKKEEIFKAAAISVEKEQGGITIIDQEGVKDQQSVVGGMIAKIGKSIFNANTLGFSIPTRILEPRGDLDRAAELYRVFCIYLMKASINSDKLERLKLVSTASVASLYLMFRKFKSFNPVLGETYQGTLADGTQIYGEQISHRPYINYMLIVGPSKAYVAYTYAEVEPQFKGNSLLLNIKYKNTIKFKDGHELVIVSRPSIKIAGIIAGDRLMILKGIGRIEDKSLKLRSVIFFDYGEKKGLITSQKTARKDWVEGLIYASNGKPFNEQAKRISDLDDVKTEVARIKGSWLEKLEINSVNYWDINKLIPQKISCVKNPLPSDWRYREDMIWAKKGNCEIADKWKDAIEIRQRRDRKLREENEKK